MIVRLRSYGKGCVGSLITVYDYGHDIRIEENIKVLDTVILMIQDNWTAKWRRLHDVSKPHLAKTQKNWQKNKNG